MNASVDPNIALRPLYETLMECASGQPADDTLARMLAAWSAGVGAMPSWLGLGPEGYQRLLERHFPGLQRSVAPTACRSPDPNQMEEIEDLRNLLLEGRTDESEIHTTMAQLVAIGCMGSDHLWQDLGLWQRADLSRLMAHHFAPLAARNTRDMKWKKFLYKQLCEAEGIYTCRAPNCEVCADYADCFGPED